MSSIDKSGPKGPCSADPEHEPRAGEADSEHSRSNTPYWLLWATGIVAFVLCLFAFLLWGINGASTLFDMVVALCT
jgi:hypothetical protein